MTCTAGSLPTPTQKGEENYELAWNFCSGNLNPKYHSYRDANAKDVDRLYNE